MTHSNGSGGGPRRDSRRGPIRGQWLAVEESINQDILTGMLVPGTKLPSETELMQRFDVGRHTVRRAVAELVSAGKLRVEQGRGTFVEGFSALRYSIALRTRFNRNIENEGRAASSEPVMDMQIPAPPAVAEALRLDEGTLVHMLIRRSFADKVPISYGRSYHPVARFPDIDQRRRRFRSMTRIYADYGIHDYLRLSTVIFARLPTAEEARLLVQPRDRPVLAVRKIDIDLQGQPIAYSDGAWAGERIQFAMRSEHVSAGASAEQRSQERDDND